MVKRGDKYGKWTILDPIDRGGQGLVYRALGAEGEPEVAIKIVKARQLKKRGRFLQEIAAQKRLTSESAANVMPLVDSNFKELQEGGVSGYLVMPLAALSLESALPTVKGRVELALEIFAGVLNGVRAAHSAGIVHRDLKPANILFRDQNLRDPLVSDFGICLLKETPDADRLTAEGETVGARYFMAPEQERGGVSAVTVAADVYALGKLLPHMLTGRNIYREECEDAFTDAELRSDPRYQLILEHVVKAAVVHDPADRISLEDLIEVVRKLRGGSEPSGGPAGLVTPPTPSLPPSESSPQLVEDEYHRLMNSAGHTATASYLITLDVMRREFKQEWVRLAGSIKDTPDQAALAAKELIARQPKALGLALALGRSNAQDMFPGFQHFLETTLREDEPRSRYPAILSVPHMLGGFLYMVATTQALTYESWDVLQLLLNEKFEWYYRSERPIYSFGFSLSYFFHPEAVGREASKTHDSYRQWLRDPSLANVLTISGEDLQNKYLQAQLLLSLRVAQESEKGNDLRIWPDYGRFYDSRVRPLFDRAHGMPKYGEGLARVFNETRSEFFSRLTPRLAFIRQNYWSGSNYFWESLTEWSPRE